MGECLLYLFCISYAGGSASIYNKWKGKSRFVKVHPIELPGHGSRAKEKLCTDFSTIVNDVYLNIYNEIKQNQINEYAIYGHSMGCWIAFEVAKKLFSDSFITPPLRLFFSGNCVPECCEYDVDLKTMSEEDFRNMIIGYGGIPQSVLKHPDILDYLMPLIKSDYLALSTYRCKKQNFKFNCDISVMNGIKDKFNIDSMKAWKKYAGKNFCLRNFNDGHFFLNTLNKEVFSSVCCDLKESLG